MPDKDPVKSIILWPATSPVPESEIVKATLPPLVNACVVKPPAICSISCKFVFVFVPQVPAFSPLC